MIEVKSRVKSNGKTVKLAYSGVLIALGILLPQTFHMFGQNAGMTFLPIEIPILLAGILLGPVYGTAVGIIVPLLSSLLTGMPPVPKVYFMAVGYAVYGLVGGLLMNRCKVLVSLIGAMIAGRIANGLAIVAGVWILNMHAPFMTMAAFTSALTMGIPGVVLQLILIPCLYMGLKRGGIIIE